MPTIYRKQLAEVTTTTTFDIVDLSVEDVRIIRRCLDREVYDPGILCHKMSKEQHTRAREMYFGIKGMKLPSNSVTLSATI